MDHQGILFLLLFSAPILNNNLKLRSRTTSKRTSKRLPLEIFSVDVLVADGTLVPGIVAERQVVQHTGPAVDVTTAGHLSCNVTKHSKLTTHIKAAHLIVIMAQLCNGREIMKLPQIK